MLKLLLGLTQGEICNLTSQFACGPFVVTQLSRSNAGGSKVHAWVAVSDKWVQILNLDCRFLGFICMLERSLDLFLVAPWRPVLRSWEMSCKFPLVSRDLPAVLQFHWVLCVQLLGDDVTWSIFSYQNNGKNLSTSNLSCCVAQHDCILFQVWSVCNEDNFKIKQ